jgi:plasmid maintenance system antidote protein VapI
MPEMALRIEKAFDPDVNHLLRMQLADDAAKAFRTVLAGSPCRNFRFSNLISLHSTASRLA